MGDEFGMYGILMLILRLHSRLCQFPQIAHFGRKWDTMKETLEIYGGITSIDVIITCHKKVMKHWENLGACASF